MMLALLLAAQAAAAPLAIGGPTADRGRCAWEHAPAAVQGAFLEGYAKAMNTGTAVLAAHDAELKAALDGCLPPVDRTAPATWREGLIGSAAIRAGAAAELVKSGGPSREALERIWAEAPEAARTCARANAGRVFGQTLACPDEAAPLAFLTAAGVNARQDTARATQILFFMNATAQTEWELGLLKAYEQACASAAGCPKT